MNSKYIDSHKKYWGSEFSNLANVEHNHAHDDGNNETKDCHAHDRNVEVRNGEVAQEEERDELLLADNHDGEGKAQGRQDAAHDLEGVEKNVGQRGDEAVGPLGTEEVDDEDDSL